MKCSSLPKISTGSATVAVIFSTAKVLARKRGKYYLEAANDSEDENGKRLYPDIHPVGDWEILGVVDNVIHSPTREVL